MMQIKATNMTRNNELTMTLTDVKVDGDKVSGQFGKTVKGQIRWFESRIGSDTCRISVWNGPKCRMTNYFFDTPLTKEMVRI
jgi:hypothetical protein